MRSVQTLLLLAVLTICYLTHAADQEKGQFAASVKAFTGAAWVDNGVSGGTQPLDASLYLYENQQIKCAKGSRLVLRLRNGDLKEITATNWVQIQSGPELRPAANLAVNGLQRAGPSRSGGTEAMAVFQPANNSSIRLTNSFVIRWIPGSESNLISLEIMSAGSGFIWRTNFACASGQADLPQLFSSLKQQQKLGISDFSLRYRIGSSRWHTMEFSVLSMEEEKGLETELKQAWVAYGEKGCFAHLARAAVLNDYQLLNEATDEYIQALNCPGEADSIDLLERAKEAFEKVGDVAKAKELAQHLKKLGVEH